MYKKKKNNLLEAPSLEESSKEHTPLILLGTYVATFQRVEEIFSSSPISLVIKDPLELV